MSRYTERPKRCVVCGDMPATHNLNWQPHCYACVITAYAQGVCRSCGHVGQYHHKGHLFWKAETRRVQR